MDLQFMRFWLNPDRVYYTNVGYHFEIFSIFLTNSSSDFAFSGLHWTLEGQAGGNQMWHRGSSEHRRSPREFAETGNELIRQADSWNLNGRIQRDAAQFP